MKYLKLFEQDEDAIYDRTSDTLYEAPGVAYIIDVDKVIYAPFDLNQKYYIDENYNAVLYRESYIDITSPSENVILSDLHKEKSYVIKFEYKKILPETISIVIKQTGNMTYSYSDITIDEETNTGEFTLTISSEEYGIDTLYINLTGTGENEQEFISNIVRYTISYEDINQPLTLYILEDGQVKFGNLDLGLSNMYYKINNGQWTKYIETLPINVRKGDKIQFKGNNTSLSQTYSYKKFSSTCKFNVSGHLGSLISEDYETIDLYDENQSGSYVGCFSHIFADSKVVDASQLIMPKVMTPYCYSGMMAGCFDLEYAPELQEFTTLYSGSYAGTFEDCQNLKYTPTKIIAINANEYSCQEMFRNCVKIQNTPKIQIENVGSGALAGTFENCVSLVTVDDIIFTTVGGDGCSNMFRNCVELRDISKFNLSSLIEGNQNSFRHTFENCTSLSILMESIELETVYTGCFCGTFAGCFSIEETPIMKYTSVGCGACCGMFEDCTNLKTVPLLDVIDLNGDDCFDLMFKNCENLNYIKTTLPDWGGDNSGNQKYTYDWVNNVANEGTFVKADFLPIIKGVSNIPTNWLVEDMEDPNLDKYLTFNILEDGDITITNKTNGEGIRLDLQYKLNDNDWENIQLETKTEVNYPYYTYYTQTLNLNQGDIIKFRGDNILTDGGYYDDNGDYLNRNNIYFSGSAKFNVSGQVSSLLSKRCNTNNVKRRSFEYLFEDCHVVDASELILTSEVREDTYSGMMAGCFDLVYGPQVLPAKNLYNECYRAMFFNCTSLETVPEIKAQSTAYSCCHEMFYGCTSLTKAPELKVNNLSEHCFSRMFIGCTNLVQIPELPIASMSTGSFSGMFENCTSLITAPELLSESLAVSCYSGMFSGCTSLMQAPTILPAETLYYSCYQGMFRGCTSLVTTPEIKAQLLDKYCCSEMFFGCSSLTQAPTILSATTLTESCYSYMFSGCTSLVTTPEIKAQSLDKYCCSEMFSGCSSLTQAPTILSATTLAESCYSHMFGGCTKITHAPELPATTLANSCYSSMFYNCSSLVEAPELPAESLKENCYNSMFSGCISLTQAPELKAKSLANGCYWGMFSSCTGLTSAPVLPATTLANYCYYNMFSNCTGLSEAPELPANILSYWCYNYMFSGCTNLHYIKVGFTTWTSSTTNNWVQNVAPEGIFDCPEALTLQMGNSYIPEGWVVPSKVSIDILNKEELETPITVEPNTTQEFTINVDLQQLTLDKCKVTSSNSKFIKFFTDLQNNSIIINFKSTTSGTFTSTITVSDNTYNTGKSDSVVLTVNVSEPENSYYLRYSYSSNDDYNSWTNQIEGTELSNGDIVFGPVPCIQYNNYVALTTKVDDTSLSDNINISAFTGSHDGSLYNLNHQEKNGKSEYRIETKNSGDYTMIFNLTNKTIYVKVYSPDEPIEPTEDTNVKAATYNIRYYNGEGDTANEGDKSWLTRRASVFDMIEKHNPDVCGLQEVTPQMTQDIIDNLPDYTYIGYGRVSGDLNPILPISTLVSSGNDEQTGLIYKTSKYTELEKGRFFVSDTPSVPSKYSESTFNRLAAYVKLKDNETGKEFYFLSTHLDHPNDGSTLDELCRVKQATALIQNAKGLVGNLPYYIVGDFNSVETEEAYPIIASELNDAYYTIGAENAQGGYNGTNNTYTGLYSSTDTTPKRIDFIFTTGNIGVSSYIADNDNMGLTLYPSDHLPVVCDTVMQ